MVQTKDSVSMPALKWDEMRLRLRNYLKWMKIPECAGAVPTSIHESRQKVTNHMSVFYLSVYVT